jgi:hypothetical protein
MTMTNKVKKIITLLLFACVYGTCVGSDSLAYSKGRIIISVGYGFAGDEKTKYSQYYTQGWNYMEDEVGPVFGPSFFKLEYAVSEGLGIGVTVNYSRYNKEVEQYQYSFYPNTNFFMGFKSQSISIMARINFHSRKLERPDKLDLYGGFGFGPIINNYTFYSSDVRGALTTTQYVNHHFPGRPYNNLYILELSAGTRIYFAKTAGMYVEVGYSTSSAILGCIGLTIKV